LHHTTQTLPHTGLGLGLALVIALMWPGTKINETPVIVRTWVMMSRFPSLLNYARYCIGPETSKLQLNEVAFTRAAHELLTSGHAI